MVSVACYLKARQCNGSKEIVGRWQNTSMCQRNNVSRVLYVKFRIHKHCFLKHFAFLKKVCYHYLHFVLRVTYCFLWAAYWSTTNFLGMYCYFLVFWLVNLCLSGPGYSNRTVGGPAQKGHHSPTVPELPWANQLFTHFDLKKCGKMFTYENKRLAWLEEGWPSPFFDGTVILLC